MELMWIIYAVDTFTGSPLPTFHFIMVVLLLIIVISFIARLVFWEDGKEASREGVVNFQSKLFHSKLVWGFVFYSLIFAPTINGLVPERGTAYKMMAGYGVQTAMENESVRSISSKSLQVLENAMDEYLLESSPTIKAAAKATLKEAISK